MDDARVKALIQNAFDDPASLSRPQRLPSKKLSAGDIPVWDGSKWAANSRYPVPTNQLSGFPNDASTVLNGIGAFVTGATRLFDVTNTSTALIDTGANGIPQTYAHLLMIYSIRANTAATGVIIGVRFNADSGNNYIGAQFDWTGAPVNPTAHTVAATNQGRIGRGTGTTAPANSFGIGLVFIPSYRESKLKLTFGISGGDETGGTAGMIGEVTHTRWSGTAAINQISVSSDHATPSHPLSGSRVTIYGL